MPEKKLFTEGELLLMTAEDVSAACEEVVKFYRTLPDEVYHRVMDSKVGAREVMDLMSWGSLVNLAELLVEASKMSDKTPEEYDGLSKSLSDEACRYGKLGDLVVSDVLPNVKDIALQSKKLPKNAKARERFNTQFSHFEEVMRKVAA